MKYTQDFTRSLMVKSSRPRELQKDLLYKKRMYISHSHRFFRYDHHNGFADCRIVLGYNADLRCYKALT